MEEERILFKTLADPITQYFVDMGVGHMRAGMMAAAIADRQFEAIKGKIKVVITTDEDNDDSNNPAK